MKAVILAAGQGARLGELTRDIPKPMISIAGKPALEHIICGMRDSGVSEFAIVVRYKAERIKDYFKDGSDFGIKIDYVEQPASYGTGAALLAARDVVGHDSILMTYGDIITSHVNYSGVVQGFGSMGGAGMMTLNWMDDPSKGASVGVDERGCVTKIIEKPAEYQMISHWHAAGLFALEPVVFEYLEKIAPSPRGEYELADAINSMISDKHYVHAYFLQGMWSDIGTLEGLKEAERLIGENGP